MRRTGEEPAIQILISLLIPFAAYLAAEHFHASGVLAAAVAGIAMHYTELSGRALAATRMQRNAVWDTVQTALNGVIFVLLGEQLPRILRSLPEVAASTGVASHWHLLAYVVLITLALAALRFLWVWLSVSLVVRWANRRGKAQAMPQTRLLIVTATAGVRGAITLAGILTLPLLMPDGSPFPTRDAAIFLAMGVILLSLLIASIGLPLLADGLADLPQPVIGSSEPYARTVAAEAAVRRIEQILGDPLKDRELANFRSEAAMRLLDVYRRRLHYGDPSGEDTTDMHAVAETERRLRIQALAAERDELFRLRRAREIDDGPHRRLVHEIDLMERAWRERRRTELWVSGPAQQSSPMDRATSQSIRDRATVIAPP